jgi:hypothetical protein
MDRIRFITHQGKRVLLVDLTNCSANDVMKVMAEVQRIVTAQPRESTLTLGDLTGAQFSRDVITRMKEVAVFDRPYVKRSAIVGAEGLPKVFYEALRTFSRREFPRFKTREEALDWLVKEEA